MHRLVNPDRVQCVVVCMGTEVTDKVLELAKEKNCRIITTPYDK